MSVGSPTPAATLASRLLAWHECHGRHDLPWQHPASPYRVWVSEIMLQQTRVATVIPYFQRFMEHFPTVEALAAAELDEVLHLWTGLGYYNRARNLHKTAGLLVNQHGGNFPGSAAELARLPGIGPSTAGAIASLALGQRAPILDGNVKRVLARLHRIAGWPGRRAVERQLWHWAEHHTPRRRVAEYTQAIMDLGATVCTPRQPDCGRCPLHALCAAHRAGDPLNYPGRRPRRSLPLQATRLIMLQAGDGRVLLERRLQPGVWQQLYSFPELAAEPPLEAALEQWCQERRIPLQGFKTLPGFRHVFSHYQLDIQPIHCITQARSTALMTGPDPLWYNLDEPATIGLAAPVQALLDQLAITSATSREDP